MKRYFSTILLSIFICTLIQAQLPIGSWRIHFAYNSVSQVAQADKKIFAVSEGSLFSINKSDKTIDLYDKTSGMNDNNVSAIEYDKSSKQLIIIYSNGNIDLMSESGIYNIPDYLNKQLAADKSINSIFIYNDKAYLSCNFGILVLNLKKKEIADTYYIGANSSEVKVLSTVIHDGYIYALAAGAIYRADVNGPFLVNYEYWTTQSGFPGSGDYQKLLLFNNSLVLLRNNKLYIQANSSWVQMLTNISVSNILVSNNKLIAYDSANGIHILNTSLNQTDISSLGVVSDAEYDAENDIYWFSTADKGLATANTAGAQVNYYKPQGPAVNIPWNMKFVDDKLYVVQGGRWSSQYFRPGYLMMYQNGVWNNLDPEEIKAQTQHNVWDFMNIAVDPFDKTHYFVTAYGNGLFEFKNDKFVKWHNFDNSTIETVTMNNYDYMRLDGAVFDKDGNLFLLNMGVKGSVKVLLKDGTWTQLAYDNGALPTMGKILISNQNSNQKWITSVRYTPGLLVFDDGGTVKDQKDDNSVFRATFTDTDGGADIAPSTFYDIAQDKNGVIWVGTDQGPLLFYNTSKVFDAGYTCTRVKIPRNDGTNYADYLLKNERIKAIAIDGANRKWLGTESSGVYLMSANGQETIRHFTAEDSPLLSNDILSIAINPKTGEVFFGTAKGLVSYQGDAVEAGSTFSNVHAYPNPVRENFSGTISITGLTENSNVKITDINGNLVFSTVSNGALATWNGKNASGKKVNTGVYLVICVNEDGTESTVTKILVIN